jgi:hypothetical protein
MDQKVCSRKLPPGWEKGGLGRPVEGKSSCGPCRLGCALCHLIFLLSVFLLTEVLLPHRLIYCSTSTSFRKPFFRGVACFQTFSGLKSTFYMSYSWESLGLNKLESLFCYFLAMVGIEPRALHIQDKCCYTTELYPAQFRILWHRHGKNYSF